MSRSGADGQRELWRAGHGHGTVELNRNLDPLAQLIGVAAIRTALDEHVVRRRRGLPAAVHLVADEFDIAFAPRPRAALVVPPAILIVPLFSVSALAAMVIPSVSLSDDCTKYSK